ncbi:hypothetical protein [Mycoplasma suis]|uniref:Uncharacterized protein n=1 Tax=Mycoplasma suis (strain Illinois) TaxID=768700 RepID=F0QRR9_MYCSL|nr:hypothetical protein [Mycoplasma suis]ADX98189.1 hypothetical protein MSU_0658 [Mycoplasma suis str. Illinois]
MFPKTAAILALMGSLGGLSISGYGINTWFRTDTQIVSPDKKRYEEENKITVKDEQIMWEMVMTSGNLEGKQDIQKICVRREKTKDNETQLENEVIKVGCNTNWSHQFNSGGGEYKLWIRGQEQIISETINESNSSFQKFLEGLTEEAKKKVEGVKGLDQICQKQEKGSNGLIEYKCR